jgi:hypothetical protein
MKKDSVYLTSWREDKESPEIKFFTGWAKAHS